MEFKRTELEMNIYGETCKLRFPVLKEFREFSKKLDESKADGTSNEFELMKEFLCMLGLKDETFESLELEHMQKIINAVTIKEKKS